MIQDNILKKVLHIGTDYKTTQGGISQLLNNYAISFPVFNFVCSTSGKSFGIKLFTFIKSIILLLYYIIFRNIEVIHIHTSSFTIVKREFLYVLVGHAFHMQVILHLHGGMFEKECKKHAPRLKKIFSKVDLVICVSDFLKDVVLKYNLSCKVLTLHNIIPIPSLTKGNRLDNDVLTMLFLGTIDENKGIFDVLDVIKDNKDYLRDRIHFVIGGTGESNRLMQLIDKYGLCNIVEYRGWIDKGEKERLFQIADIYIQPSYFESFGLSLLEASSYGIPVLSSKAGGIPDVIKDGYSGLLIEPGNKDLLWKNLKKLIESRALREYLGINGIEFSKKFYPCSVLSNLVSIYINILNGK